MLHNAPPSQPQFIYQAVELDQSGFVDCIALSHLDPRTSPTIRHWITPAISRIVMRPIMIDPCIVIWQVLSVSRAVSMGLIRLADFDTRLPRQTLQKMRIEFMAAIRVMMERREESERERTGASEN